MVLSNRPKSVAVMVHNDVVRDARVLKEAKSLSSAGLTVTVFGMSDQASSSSDEGVTVRLVAFRGTLLKRLMSALLHSKQALLAAGVVGSALYMAALSAIAILEPSLVWLLLALTAVLAIFGYAFKGTLWRTLFVLYRTHNWYVMARLLQAAVQEDDYDSVHTHDLIGLIAGSRIKEKRPSIHLIWDAHEIYEQQGATDRFQSQCLRALIKRHSRKVDAFITINESISEFYERHYHLPPAQIVMNATVFAGPVADDGRLRRASGLGGDRKILLFHGGFSNHRGIGQLMAAARGLPHPWTIVMIGWGKLEPAVRKLADQLESVHGRENAPLVILPPVSQTELPAWVAGADLGAIPYENIGLNHLYCTPNKLWEYPNAGVPILATSLVEMEKMIKEWGTGFLLPRNFSGRDIVDALGRITEQELQETRARCVKFSECLSWQVFEPKLLKAYDRA